MSHCPNALFWENELAAVVCLWEILRGELIGRREFERDKTTHQKNSLAMKT